jgi:hypothetical protein
MTVLSCDLPRETRQAMKRWAVRRIAILAYHPARHAATLAILVMSLPWPRRRTR